MAGNSTRKHYRVAKKEIEQAPDKGTFIQKRDKHKILIVLIALLILSFVKGLVMGYLLGSKND